MTTRDDADKVYVAQRGAVLVMSSLTKDATEHVLREISVMLREAPDVETVLQVAVEGLGRALGASSGSARLERQVGNGGMGEAEGMATTEEQESDA